jgi:hypothetical protein
MDGDENDLLSTNKYIHEPDVDSDIKDDGSDFKSFYKQEFAKMKESSLRESLERMSLKSANYDEETDANSIMNTNKFVTDKSEGSAEGQRYQREVVTYVSIDSRDRDKIMFPKPSHFKIFLGKTFYNVKSIRLAKLEFPNTDAVINSSNNKIYWRNVEDIEEDIIDTITQTYPVYSSELMIGTYISTSLQNEISKTMSQNKRKNKIGPDFHYFTVDLDVDTDIVTFTSLILSSLNVDPISVLKGSGVVTVDTSTPHGFRSGDIVYMVGAKVLGAIPSSVLNGPHVVSIIGSHPTSTQFQYEVNLKSAETAFGGGNAVSVGTPAPFQFLFGENERTIAPNLGFPLENSSDRINTFIKTIEKLFLARVETKSPHGFDNSNVNSVCLLIGTGTTPNLDGNRVIYKIIDAQTFLISINSEITSIGNSGSVTVNGKTTAIQSITNNIIDTVLIETFSDHNYTNDDTGLSITFYDTNTTPDLNTTHRIYGVLSSTRFFIQATLMIGGGSSVSVEGNGGSIPRFNPLRTQTIRLTNLTPGPFTTFQCDGHNLQVGQKIRFYNIKTFPSITDKNNGIHEVNAIPDSNHFTVDFATNNFDLQSLTNAYVGTNVVTMSFPNHGFNKLINITNGTTGTVEIQTLLPHKLVNGDTVRIMQTNSVPVIDDGGYVVTVTDSDTFTIQFGSMLTSNGDSGILGMSNDFVLYGATSLGGVNQQNINGKQFRVQEIIDENTFTFEVNGYASSEESGGGSNLYISSLLHGFNGVQQNTKNSLLNRSINLEGENYAFLCCPQLATMLNTGRVKDIFARITLDQSPGNMVFNFLTNPKEFDTVPLGLLSELEFSVRYYNNNFYEFNDLDFSFVLEITEIIDTNENFGFSSKRGVTNAPSSYTKSVVSLE